MGGVVVDFDAILERAIVTAARADVRSEEAVKGVNRINGQLERTSSEISAFKERVSSDMERMREQTSLEFDAVKEQLGNVRVDLKGLLVKAGIAGAFVLVTLTFASGVALKLIFG